MTTIKSMAGARLRSFVLALATGIICAGLLPSLALAHVGPANPVASSYLARIDHVPDRVQAKVVGGDLRMWLRVAPTDTVIVVDYRGAPYLRFWRAGVAVNTNSAMYYLNQPTPVTPPSNLSATTRPRWELASTGHDFVWHDGRLHALAAVALAPGQRFVGRWKIPLVIDGRRTAITGGLWHADDPSIVWFWPIAVLLASLWAVCRLGRREVDRVVAYALALVALAAIAVLALGHQLYGEPFVSTGQLIILGLILAGVAVLVVNVVLRGPGPFSLIVIAVASLYAGLVCLPTLLHGFVLAVVPAFLTRAATVACLACGAGTIVLLFGFRLLDLPEQADAIPAPSPDEDRDPWESLL